MGKNSDTNNIFSSYMDNVLLKEAVKPTEEGGPFDPAAAKAAREKMMQRQRQFVSQQASQQQQPVATTATAPSAPVPAPQQQTTTQPITQPASVAQQPTQPATQPATQPEPDDESGYEEVETTQETIPANVQAQPLVTADDGTSYTVDQIKSMIGDVTKSFDQDEQESDDEGWEEMGSSGDKENVTDEYETVISGNTTTIRPKNLKEPFEDQDDQEEEGWQEVGEPEVENVTDEYTSTTSEAQYKESVNIAKFLKCLSEKNYAMANKYLKNIVENKIKRKISKQIK